LIRATRRRWFFGGDGQIEICFPHGLQFDLLALMVVGVEEQGKILLRIMQTLKQECIEEIGQALAEVSLKSPNIRNIPEWGLLLQGLWQQVSCPLLHFSSSYLLGIAVLLKNTQIWKQNSYSFFEENIHSNNLQIWQQKQWEECKIVLE
jgi:hypothetical protein